MTDDILTELNRLVQKMKPKARLEAGKHLTKDIGLDSLNITLLFFEAEKHFAVSITEEDIDAHDLFKVDNLVAYIAQKGAL